MRIVEILEFKNDGYNNIYKTSTGNFGYLLTWSTDYEEFQNGVGQYPCAIVELFTGEVKVIHAELIKFHEESSKMEDE